jgi:hypothetical protein
MTMSALQPMTEPTAPTAPPREPRLGRFIGIIVERPGRDPEKAVASNVSRIGLGGKGSIVLHPGERIVIAFPDHSRHEATVRWAGNGRFGVEFDTPIDPDRVRFSPDAWNEVRSQPPVVNSGFEIFRPVSSTRRPGLRVR